MIKLKYCDMEYNDNNSTLSIQELEEVVIKFRRAYCKDVDIDLDTNTGYNTVELTQVHVDGYDRFGNDSYGLSKNSKPNFELDNDQKINTISVNFGSPLLNYIFLRREDFENFEDIKFSKVPQTIIDKLFKNPQRYKLEESIVLKRKVTTQEHRLKNTYSKEIKVRIVEIKK